MNELIWSFVDRLEKTEGGRLFHLTYKRENLWQIGYPEAIQTVPEGLLIEGAAQVCGLTLFLDDPEFHSLPVLARVNRASFLRPAPIERRYSVQPSLNQLSDAGGAFEGVCRDGLSGEIVAEIEILLGFVSFSEIPKGGEGVRTRLKNFIRGLRK